MPKCSKWVNEDAKIKRSCIAKKGHIQIFTEPWGENELQIKMSTWCINLIGTDGERGLSSFSLRGQTWGVVITNLARQDEPVGRWIHRDCLLFWQVSVLVNLSGNYRINWAIFTLKHDSLKKIINSINYAFSFLQFESRVILRIGLSEYQ